ncbi:MAG: autotransporter-associated beta strand repeat-containing protein, partial [Planctomycetia bacterium]|nr:autotransporter-associated beta strand repeat-containing protein [Planctomycetia bacterium]
STTITGTNASGIRQTLVAAAFAPTLKDGSISMPTTTVDVAASTIFNLSAAPATTATFGDLQMDAGTLSFTSAPPSVTFSNIKATGNSAVAAGTGIDLSGGQIDVDPLAVLTVNAVVGGTNVTKIGAGKVALTGNDTYTGTTTVNNGTLAINGTHAAGAGNLTVNSNGRLQGSGGTDADLFVVGGTVAPGNSIQSLGTGSISFSGGTFEYELDTSLTPGDTADLLYGDNNSTLSLTGSPALSLIDLGGNLLLPIGTKFTLIAYDTPWDGTSIFDTYANNSIFSFAGNYWTIKYDDTVAGVNFNADATATDTTFVTITTVELASPAPEPSTIALAGLGLVGLGCVALRKKYRRT